MSDIRYGQLVSVIIPTKDRCSLLIETLRTVQGQTYANWEAIVVDDHSEDDTWSVLEGFSSEDRRIRPVRRTGPVGGGGEARNQGLLASRGALVLFLDSDDLLMPTALEHRIKKFCEFPEYDAIVGDAEYFRNAPGEYHNECIRSRHLLDGVGVLDAFLTGQSLWMTTGPLWRRAALEELGGWKSSQDNQFHTRAIVMGVRFLRTNCLDWYIRVHQGPQESRVVLAAVAQEESQLDLIELLQANGVLTRRTKRMIAWACLMNALTSAYQGALPELSQIVRPWKGAERKGLVEKPIFIIGLGLLLLQWLRSFGPIPRECARGVIYLDLKKSFPFSGHLLGDISDYIDYMIMHSRNWAKARIERARMPDTALRVVE